MDIVRRVCCAFGIKGLDDARWFCYGHLQETPKHIEGLMPLLRQYYIPCKAKLFCDGPMTVKRCLTVLKQLARLYRHDLITILISQQRVYYIVPKEYQRYRIAQECKTVFFGDLLYDGDTQQQQKPGHGEHRCAGEDACKEEAQQEGGDSLYEARASGCVACS